MQYSLPSEVRAGRDSGKGVASSTTAITTVHLPVSACRDRSLAHDACPGEAHSMNENRAEQVRLYTLEEAAKRLRVSRECLYRMRRRGQLTVVKFGRRTLVEPAELDRVIAAARTNPAA